ncbi:RNA-binding protein pop5 [Tritrichomonas musculus]|uniref:Ribonuclease P/MRP protein subunit POP5 n=1 Tax=Tritrichomonas musculus TaxID=1915356 RepID=A0ABR2JL95_9EUKA
MVRIKWRYILFQTHATNDTNTYGPTAEQLISGLQQPFMNEYGVFGWGHVWPTLKALLWSPNEGIGLFRVPRDWCTQFVNFLQSLTSINNVPLTIKVHHISGTIDQCQRWLDENGFTFEINV